MQPLPASRVEDTQSQMCDSTPPGLDGFALVDLSPLPLTVLSPSCSITRVSERFLRDWHVSRDECVGQQLLSFVEKQLRPAGSSAVCYLSAAIDDAVASRSERTTKHITTQHAASWRARVMPIFKGAELLAIMIEWHEGATALVEDELVRPGLSTDEAFRILVQAVKDYAIFLLDTKGRIATWNTGAELLKGYRREEIIGQHFSIFYGQEDLDVRKPQLELEICLREGRVEDEGWRYKKDGTRFWANVIITAVYKDGVHVGFGKVTRDLTERKTSESRLIAAYEESEKLKSDFLANMSHEIRTPMHGMLSACSLLLDTPLSERQQDIVHIMDESGQVLLQVINDILDYSKLASGTFSITSDIVGITSIITSVVRSAQTTVPPSIRFELFLGPELPKSVQGDPLRYRQILHNLVSNASKFTDSGIIRVTASVQDESEDTYIVLTEVVDTGIGIPEPAAAGLFTPFTQFDVSTTKRYKGTGLGLSIAKSLVELMGGHIGYRPNPEPHGSIFWFTARFKKIKSLEQIQDWKGKGRDESPVPPNAAFPDLQAELGRVASKKNILLAEDNVINQKVMIGMLRSLGFKNIVVAANGAEAVKMVRGKPAAYDMVLMDINMPILGGHEATVKIRESGIGIPIVAMTAYALKGDKENCLEHGMDDYIPKPVDKQQLVKTLCKWLLRAKDYRIIANEIFARTRPSAKLRALPLTAPLLATATRFPQLRQTWTLNPNPPKMNGGPWSRTAPEVKQTAVPQPDVQRQGVSIEEEVSVKPEVAAGSGGTAPSVEQETSIELNTSTEPDATTETQPCVEGEVAVEPHTPKDREDSPERGESKEPEVFKEEGISAEPITSTELPKAMERISLEPEEQPAPPMEPDVQEGTHAVEQNTDNSGA
ncbi:hypothetical protein QBC47DRAFT_377509 [Echria macrotheca]|uniref:Two-component system protein A n=1 Tax=Echria macrotheca TaxID=438768 RepID=A0AAJ0BIZ2_9PEZI|nr:hypothetical protein QBC47DRAFT_377509 [Echria macrotheca]